MITKKFILLLIPITMLVNCSFGDKNNKAAPDKNLSFKKQIVKDSSKLLNTKHPDTSIYLYYLGYDIIGHNLYDTIFRYYPIDKINDSLAILEGTRTVIFMAFKSKSKKRVYFYVNDNRLFDYESRLNQMVELNTPNWVIKKKFKNKLLKNNFKIETDIVYETLSYKFSNKKDTINLDQEGLQLGGSMTDDFMEFSKKFYIGVKSEEFFENWGIKPIYKRNFTVYIYNVSNGLYNIWKIKNKVPEKYLDCNYLPQKYKTLLNCNNSFNGPYRLIFKDGILTKIYF